MQCSTPGCSVRRSEAESVRVKVLEDHSTISLQLFLHSAPTVLHITVHVHLMSATESQTDERYMHASTCAISLVSIPRPINQVSEK
jgi:hypothetical protein